MVIQKKLISEDEFNFIKYDDVELVSGTLDIVLSDMAPPKKEILIEWIKILESRHDSDCEDMRYIISLCHECLGNHTSET